MWAAQRNSEMEPFGRRRIFGTVSTVHFAPRNHEKVAVILDCGAAEMMRIISRGRSIIVLLRRNLIKRSVVHHASREGGAWGGAGSSIFSSSLKPGFLDPEILVL